MKLQLIAALSLLSLATVSAQTKKIAFESHSGNLSHFHSTLNNEFFDGGESNYGLPSSKSKFKLDSVILINDSTSLLVSKEYQAPFQSKSENDFRYVGVKKDTVFNNQLLKRKNSIDSIRNGIKNIYGSWDLVEATIKTVFIGFDSKEPRDKKSKGKQNVVPVFRQKPPSGNSPFDGQLWLIVSATMLLSFAGGWVTWKWYKPQPAIA